MRHLRHRIADDAFRHVASLDLSKLQVILPIRSAERRLFRAALFSGARPRFSQQIPKVICERSCRMAKTLSVNITPILKKESGKTKKREKKILFWVFFTKKGEKPEQKQFRALDGRRRLSTLRTRSRCRREAFRKANEKSTLAFSYEEIPVTLRFPAHARYALRYALHVAR